MARPLPSAVASRCGVRPWATLAWDAQRERATPVARRLPRPGLRSWPPPRPAAWCGSSFSPSLAPHSAAWAGHAHASLCRTRAAVAREDQHARWEGCTSTRRCRSRMHARSSRGGASDLGTFLHCRREPRQHGRRRVRSSLIRTPRAPAGSCTETAGAPRPPPAPRRPSTLMPSRRPSASDLRPAGGRPLQCILNRHATVNLGAAPTSFLGQHKAGSACAHARTRAIQQ